MINVGINGFGRIGRLILEQFLKIIKIKLKSLALMILALLNKRSFN